MPLFVFIVSYTVQSVFLWLCWSYVTADFMSYINAVMSNDWTYRLAILILNLLIGSVALTVALETNDA